VHGLRPGNLLRQVDDEEWVYDEDDGALRMRSHRNTSITYTHDALWQLVSFEWSDGRPAWTCRYDALGRRVSSDCGSDKQTTFVLDGDRIAAEKSPDGRVPIDVCGGHAAV
jgi:YD repeat-containing protein